MKGLVVFNSHAFNLTDHRHHHEPVPEPVALRARRTTSTRLSRSSTPTTSSSRIVPPFETREYCATFTIPDGANLFWLSSHTHRHGVRWRTWGPPNEQCDSGAACVPVCEPGSPGCTCEPGVCAPPGAAGDDRLMYYSTVYNDPQQLAIKPPLTFTGNAADRRFLFCGLYDNGSDPLTSPSVKRQSTSPYPPTLPIGGPCDDSVKACINPSSPAKQGQLCASQPDPDRFCDSTPGAYDGLCDACPLLGGFTTEDEMYILLGNFFVTP